MYYLELNKIYYFQCVSQFSTLNGIYEVIQKKTYPELISDGIDMVALCYDKAGLTSDDWDADAESMQNDVFYKLAAPSDNLDQPFIWLPDSKIAAYPDSSVYRYKKLMVMLNLGIFEDSNELSSSMQTIKNLLLANHGISTDALVTKYSDIWLTEAQYDNVVQSRDSLKGTTVNYISENNRLVSELNQANARIAALEALVAALDANQP